MNATKILELSSNALNVPEMAAYYLEQIKQMAIEDMNAKKRSAGGQKALCQAFLKIQKNAIKKQAAPAIHNIITENGATFVMDSYRLLFCTKELDGIGAVEPPTTYPKYADIIHRFTDDNDWRIALSIPDAATVEQAILAYKANKRRGSGLRFPELKGYINRDVGWCECGINPEWLKEAIKAGITTLYYNPKQYGFVGTGENFIYIICGIRVTETL